MPSAAYVGRVGGLAVALGIGAALMSGLSVGSAWADGSAGTTTAQAGTASNPAATPEAPSDAAETPAKATPAGTDESNHDADESEEADEDTDALSAAQVDPATITSVQPKGSRRSESHPDTADTATTPGAASRVSKADAASDVSSADDADTAAMTAAVADTIDMAQSPAISPLRVASTRSASLAVSSAEPSLAAITPAARETGPVDVVSRLVSGVVNAILSPFAVNSTRDQSAGVPLAWSLLAFARREFDAVFTPHSTRETTIDPVTTSETEPRTLILSAFPAEADAVLARTTLDPNPTVVVDGHHFYLGSIGGKKVIVAMTGIGMQNATQTTEVALDHFTAASGISIGAVVFSGVAGGSGRTEIGSVAVPARWTSDDGATWHAVDPDMLAAANGLTVDLESVAPLGDPFCSCNPLARLPLVDLKREPQMFVGGDGSSDDNNNRMAFPAIPFGGDIFGPQPCTAPDRSLLSTGNFLQAIVPFLANSLLSNLTGLLMPQAPAVDAVDQETAAAQQVAEAHGIPFLGIRGMSDGPGDPLGLPGYPFTFVAYRQLAADNAANVTEAFLQSWDGPR